MPIVRVETFIKASPELCFDLARDIDIHIRTTSAEKAIAGVTTGMMELWDFVTFEAVHLGFKHRLTSQIVEFEKPEFFIDK